MPQAQIRKIYLSLIRTFPCYLDDPLDDHFSFLKDRKAYYDKVVNADGYLGTQTDKNIPGVGRLRSVLDTKSTAIKSCESSPDHPDTFFLKFQDYYKRLFAQNLILIPHFPCVIDILPSNNGKYHVDALALPGSLSDAKNAKISISIRIYPAGLASLRFGLFLSTVKSFDIEDVITLLWQKSASVNVNGLQPNLNIEKLTNAYGDMLLKGLHNKQKQVDWDGGFTYSFVDIVEAAPLTTAQNYNDVFLPLLGLNEKLTSANFPANNLSRNGDVLLIGPKSVVFYLAPKNLIPNQYISADQRKVRRWIRNSIELFSIQQFVSNNIEASAISELMKHLTNENWLKTLKNGILSPSINSLFSYWNYTNLHNQNYPLDKQDWKNRYAEMLKILDKGGRINQSEKRAMDQLSEVEKDANQNQKKVGDFIGKLIDFLKGFLI